jgi:mono/diheme cytochrome c family protein
MMLVVAAIMPHCTGILVRESLAQTKGRDAGSSSIPSADDLQRSARDDNYSQVSDHGVGRGETVYFYKCWMCHNKYAKSAPYLHDLYQRPNLVSGKPVTDVSVTELIKKGSAAMPAFGTTVSDAEVADLIAYIRSGKCCVEGEDPPANPWYLADSSTRFFRCVGWRRCFANSRLEDIFHVSRHLVSAPLRLPPGRAFKPGTRS